MSYIKDLSETIYNKLQELVQKLYTNKRFIEDAKKEYDLNKNVEHKSLSEEDKKRIISFITDTVDCNAVKRHYNFLVEMILILISFLMKLLIILLKFVVNFILMSLIFLFMLLYSKNLKKFVEHQERCLKL